MNFKSIKIIYVFDIIFVVILFSRFTKLFDLLKLFYFTFKGIFFDPDFSSAAINWFIIYALFTVILVFLYPLFRIFFYKKLCSYRMSIKITHWIIAALIFCFLFAPLISTHNPNLQHDLRVAKLLSPLCSKKSQ